ncbi:MAG: FAD-dependent monooxygenase [Terrimicrobiaceae bacterium]
MRILIVGAGVGGLALAALLRQRGVDCMVVERSQHLGAPGHVISLYPAGSRILHGLHGFEAFQEVSEPLDAYEIFGANDELLHHFDMRPSGVASWATRQILRGDLVNLLLTLCDGVEIRMGCEVTGLEADDAGVTVRLSNGSPARFDGVVGCDGIRSAIRALGFTGDDPENTGWKVALWWGDATATSRNTISEIWRRGWLVGIYPARDRAAIMLAAPCEHLDHALECGHLHGLNGWAAELLAGHFQAGDPVSLWNLSDMRVRRCAAGRLSLLGDAACSFLPLAGAGASMALESAAVLADELSRCDAESLPLAFSLYEKRRRPRVEAAQEEARRLAAWMTAESAAMVWTRERLLKLIPSDSPAEAHTRRLHEPI